MSAVKQDKAVGAMDCHRSNRWEMCLALKPLFATVRDADPTCLMLATRDAQRGRRDASWDTGHTSGDMRVPLRVNELQVIQSSCSYSSMGVGLIIVRGMKPAS